MKIKIVLLLLSVFLLTFCSPQKQKKEKFTVLELAPTPPMGWNSYNTYGIDINAQKVKDAADAMISSGMSAAGYKYVVIDDGWQIARDADGRIIADSTRFPNGMKPVVDYVHSKGLKFGIYTDMGTLTCGSKPGSLGYEEIDAQTYAEWGVDFIKADWCNTDGLDTRTQYKILSDAIIATGRPMILSICEWGTTSPWQWGKGIGSMWRTTNDIQDCFDCVRSWGGMGWVPLLEKNVDLAPFAGPGHWNDPDMLEVGNRSLNVNESKAHFSMWCMLAAPLIAGNTLSTMKDSIRDVLTAPEIIAIDQDPLGKQGTRVRNENGLQVWQKPLSDGSIAVALLNVSKEDALMNVSLEEIGFKNGEKSTVRDLWEQEDLPEITEGYQTMVPSHDVVVIKIKGEKAPVSVFEFEQQEVSLNEGNHKIVHLNIVPQITPYNVTSSNEDIATVSIIGVNTYRIEAKKVGEITLNAITADGNTTASCVVDVKPSTIPDPWKLDDVNDDKASAEYRDGVFTIEGGGKDIWGGLDQFAFMNREAENDSYISARIISLTNTDPWAKTGLMIRETNSPGSSFVMISVTSSNGISIQWRDGSGNSCSKKDFRAPELPVFFKLEKEGATFTAYQSTDGNKWEKLGDVSLNQSFSEEYLVGMAVCSHSSVSLNLSKFDEVKLDEKL